MIVKAEILTEWIGDSLTPETAWRPRLIDDYATISYTNTTGDQNMIPDPPIFTGVFTMEDAVLDAIEADNNYFVLWSEDVEE